MERRTSSQRSRKKIDDRKMALMVILKVLITSLPFLVPVASKMAWIALPAFARFSSQKKKQQQNKQTKKNMKNKNYLCFHVRVNIHTQQQQQLSFIWTTITMQYCKSVEGMIITVI